MTAGEAVERAYNDTPGEKSFIPVRLVIAMADAIIGIKWSKAVIMPGHEMDVINKYKRMFSGERLSEKELDIQSYLDRPDTN